MSLKGAMLFVLRTVDVEDIGAMILTIMPKNLKNNCMVCFWDGKYCVLGRMGNWEEARLEPYKDTGASVSWCP